MPSQCRLRSTIRRFPRRWIASSPGAWQKIPKTVSPTATDSLLLFIHSRVRVLPPRRRKPGIAFRGRSPADCATSGSPPPLVCSSPLRFRHPVSSALACWFRLSLRSASRRRKCQWKPSIIQQRQRQKQLIQWPRASPSRNSPTGASFTRQSYLRLPRSKPVILKASNGMPLLLPLRLWRWHPNPRPRRFRLPACILKSRPRLPKALWPSLRIAN